MLTCTGVSLMPATWSTLWIWRTQSTATSAMSGAPRPAPPCRPGTCGSAPRTAARPPAAPAVDARHRGAAPQGAPRSARSCHAAARSAPPGPGTTPLPGGSPDTSPCRLLPLPCCLTATNSCGVPPSRPLMPVGAPLAAPEVWGCCRSAGRWVSGRCARRQPVKRPAKGRQPGLWVCARWAPHALVSGQQALSAVRRGRALLAPVAGAPCGPSSGRERRRGRCCCWPRPGGRGEGPGGSSQPRPLSV